MIETLTDTAFLPAALAAACAFAAVYLGAVALLRAGRAPKADAALKRIIPTDGPAPEPGAIDSASHAEAVLALAEIRSARLGADVILVDELSVSAAENFAGIMQKSGFATVIGQRTPGQLLWGEGFPLDDDVMALIPVAEIIYPDGTSLEGVGVKPDREIELNRDSLLNGVDTQLQAAVELLTNSF